jgi:hypothetical protein
LKIRGSRSALGFYRIGSWIGLPVHLVNHLVTMANLHHVGRYDRMSDDVLTLTGQGSLTVQEFVRKNAATFTVLAKEASVSADARIQQIGLSISCSESL